VTANIGVRVKLAEEKVSELLKDFGVTAKETEIYIFLAKHGALKAIEISKRAKTHKALVYRILASLENKGLVTPTLEAPARFTAVNFETLIDLNIKAKREEAALLENAKKEMLHYWKNINQTKSEQALEKFTVIEGRNKIYPRISQMIKETKEQFCAVASVPSLLLAEQYGALDSALSHPLRSKIQFRFLTELNEQNLSEIRSLLKKTPAKGFNFKGRTPDLGLSMFPRMAIRDSEEILFFITPTDSKKMMEKDDVCLWTNSKALIQAFKTLFEDLWFNATDIMASLATIDSGRSTFRSYIIADEETARNKYDAAMTSAKKEVIVMTSSKGLIACAQSTMLLKQLAKRSVTLKIMAPIVNENLEAAKQLSKNHEVRHVPVSYLGTTIIDGRHLFQFKAPDSSQEGIEAWPVFGNTYYTNDSRHVRRILTMLNNVWKNASIPSAVTLESLYGPSLATVSFSEAQRGTNTHVSSGVLVDRKDFATYAPSQMMAARRTTGHALVHPPSYFSMPDMEILVHHYLQQSPFGEGITLEVYLQLETPKGLEYVPVAILETNLHPGVLSNYKKIYGGTPAAQNIQLVKPDQLQARLTGTNFFAGWTVPIPLPPTSKSLPPSCILFEGYGNIKSKPYTWSYPSGFKAMIDWNGFDAFVTFLDPTWRYAGPGTHGLIGTDVTVAAIPPINN
jgi:sugar-specific transcriptional regulator TrmB